jgi:twitching motility protein PilU
MSDIKIDSFLNEMVKRKASDLYLTHDCAPAIRVGDTISPLGTHALTDDDLEALVKQVTSTHQQDEFSSTLELNTALNWQNESRFRVNLLRQQGHAGIVIRRIQMEIPTLEELSLPQIYGDLVLQKRGLVLIVGPTGSGKTTSLAGMVGYRNRFGEGHIITVEDPIEFVHKHNQCIITQRDVGLDTYSYTMALKNALRQRPDLVVIGEVRDREVMEQAIHFAETGHLCIATLHANNSSQAIERVLNFFPEERHHQILLNLALNLRAVFSQRLVKNVKGTRTLALELMLNTGLIRQLIEENKIRHIREMIEKGSSEGMQTFDQHLYQLLRSDVITEEVALAEADNPSNFRLRLTNDRGATRLSHDMLLKKSAVEEVKTRHKADSGNSF